GRRADCDPGGADGDRGPPDEGVRRGAAAADGDAHRLRQRRHGGGGERQRGAEHDGHGGEPGARGRLSDHGGPRHPGGRQPHLHSPARAPPGPRAPPNYSFTFEPGTLTVTAATLTVTASNKTKTYGQTVTFAGT